MNTAWSAVPAKNISAELSGKLSQRRTRQGSTSRITTIRLFFSWDRVRMADTMTAEKMMSKKRLSFMTCAKNGVATT